MFLTLNRLCDRANGLGNHVRKYSNAIARYREKVVSRLEETGNLGRVSFGDPAPNLRNEMQIVAGVACDENEQKEFLSFYYALQYIIMEVHSLDILKYHLIQKGERSAAYARCISYAQRRFQELTESYLNTLCPIMLPPRFRGRYVVMGVGTMGDRDDIDVAVIDDLEEQQRCELSTGLSRLAQVMLQTSSTLHFHMAEAVGSQSLTDSLARYERYIRRRPYDPVVLSQVVSATPLVGEERLASQFVRRVAGRFYFHPGQQNKDHEGLLRALLGEMSESLRRRMPPNSINPKEDGLRPLKAYLTMCRSIYHIPSMDWGGILEFLRSRSSRYEAEYDVLSRVFVFLETVRYLHQLMVVEDEQIQTREPEESSALETVARHMAFHRRGSLSAQVPFLVSYYDQVDALRSALDLLKQDLVDHLKRISSFSFFLNPAAWEGKAGSQNLALKHALEARRFYGARYWEDLLEEFSRPGSDVPARYVGDLARLPQRKRRAVLHSLVQWGVRDPVSFVRFLTVIRRPAEETGHSGLLPALVDMLLSEWGRDELAADNLAAIFSLWPTEIHRFLRILSERQILLLQLLAGGSIRQQPLIEAGASLRRLLEIHGSASRPFLELFCKASEGRPQLLACLTDPSELQTLADSLYGRAERFADLFSRREWLAAYYQLETVRLGLEFMAGRPYEAIVRDYRLGMHVLLRSLYFLCRKELYDLYGMEWSKRHSISILLGAGLVDFHPFDPNLRMIIISFHHDEEIERFFGEVVNSFRHELATIGIEPEIYPRQNGAPFAPYRIDRWLELLQGRFSDENEALEILGVLEFSHLVGTQGHFREFSREVIDPLLGAKRGEINRKMYHRLEDAGALLSLWGGNKSVDPVSLPGGLEDTERFCRLVALNRGLGSGEEEFFLFSLAAEQSGECAELQRNTRLLQVLMTARRLLRWDEEPAGAGFECLKNHPDILKRHHEVTDAFLDDPQRYLLRLGERNAGLMKHLFHGLYSEPQGRG